MRRGVYRDEPEGPPAAKPPRDPAQLPLFLDVPLRAPAYPVATSLEAARTMDEPARGLRFAVFNLLAEHGPQTCDAIEKRLELRHQTVSSRLWELERLGLIHKTRERRVTRSGRSAWCYDLSVGRAHNGIPFEP